MTSSPYARVGAKLVDQGYSAIPCRPDSKVPGIFTPFGAWKNQLDWTQYCERLPVDIEVELWSTWPDAGVCIALGGEHGLIAVDIDTDDPAIVAAIEAALGDLSFVQKAGRKGFTLFYRAGPAVVSRAFSINGERVLDLLCKGKQTVIPPTIHKDTGEPYRWLSGTLEHVAPENLPVLPDEVAARLGAALAPFGYEAPVERPQPVGEGDGAWDDVKAMALANLDAWVPHLGIDAKRRGKNGWRGIARWRNGDGMNVSFHPTGIKDYGDGDRGMSAIDVVMDAMGLDFADAVDWLKDKLGIQDPPLLHFEFRRKAGEAEVSRAVDFLEKAATVIRAVTEAPDVAEFNMLGAGGAVLRVTEAPDVASFKVDERPKPKRGLKFEWLDEIEESNRDWLVWGLIGKREMSAWYGEPSAGKSILAGDLAFHVAHGLSWMKMDVVKTPVAYFAAERAGLVGRRLRGLKSHLKIKGKSDLIVISGALDIRDPRDTAGFIAGIKRAGEEAGAPVGLVIIDTYSRALGGGDENGPLDGGAAVVNIQQIADETGAHVLIIHHVGNAEDAKGRLRGWSGLNGAIDTSVLVRQPKRDGVVFWMVQKENDPLGGERLPPHKVKIRGHKTGDVDAKGNDVTAPYLELLSVGKGECADGEGGDAGAPRESKMERLRRAFVEAYRHLSNEVEPTFGKDKRTKVYKVPISDIRNHMANAGILEDDSRSRKDFSLVKQDLVMPGSDQKFMAEGNLIWEQLPYFFKK